MDPSLCVGYEEAIFLAGKIKHDLSGSLSTEKVLYLMLMVIEEKSRQAAFTKTQLKD